MNRYSGSERHLLVAESVIPLGSQTFSKSKTQYPVGVSPLFARKAKGARIQDIDGNWYVDLVNSLAAITIGYGDKDISKAVRKQLKKGVIYSLPGVIEAEVASLLVELVPSAELVRFGKNGTDATSAAVRLARAYTGREIIAVCGYHGWQDWYIGSTTRDKGVPLPTKNLTRSFKFNDLDSLSELISEFPNQIAAVVMEPMNTAFPEKNFLQNVRKLCDEHGIVLVFDETITGFRFSSGGAQELFDVIPDISTFGKGLANGFPLSAVVGKRQIMKEMEEIFFSGTFGGELLSLSAAKVVLEKHKKSKFTSILASKGENLKVQVQNIINETGLQEVISLSGHPTWIFLNWTPTSKYSTNQLKTFFMQEMFKYGVLILNSHNISLAFGKKEQKIVLSAYSKTLHKLSEGIATEKLQDMLLVEPLTPLFKVR
ncbi:HemL Glutamate-1-semialdehyde aminotransferase [Candidatus Nanopelagicaceae bacterium]